MNALGPLDAVITGYAYENATLALGVLEGGAKPGSWISTEMLCTLDNFIKVVLFSDRIYIYPLHTEISKKPDGPNESLISVNVTDYPVFGASAPAKSVFEQQEIFHLVPLDESTETPEQEYRRTEGNLKTVKVDKDVWCILSATWPENSLRMWQEMLVYDLVFMDTAIHKCGLDHFKPVFPGEHIYLGLREDLNRSQTIADLAVCRLRALVRQKLSQLNDEQVPLGAVPLPVLPPLFVSRLLTECTNRTEIAATLFRIRKSGPFRRFRKCIGECHKMLQSEDAAQRTRASEVIKLLNQFDFQDKTNTAKLVKHGFNVAKAIAAGLTGGIIEPVQEIFELSSILFKSLSTHALLALNEFSGTKADPVRLDAYFKKNFGDQFDLTERHSVSTLLLLPENARDWQKENVSFEAAPGRLDATGSPLSRPYQAETRTPILSFNQMLESTLKATRHE